MNKDYINWCRSYRPQSVMVLAGWARFALSSAQKGAAWIMTVPKPTPLAAGAKSVVVDHTKLPNSLDELSWDHLPKEYNPNTDPNKIWAPTEPKNFVFIDYPNYIDDPEAGKAARRGRVSTLIVLSGIFLLWRATKRDKEMLGLNHTPPECLRWVS